METHRILVTGGSGFIGSHIVDKLVNKGYYVRVMDIIPPHRSDVDFFKGDITSYKDMQNAIVDIDFIYHIAAMSNIDNIEAQPLQAIYTNLISTGNVLEVARNSNINRVVLASTYFAGSGHGHIYTTTKEASEMLCKDYNKLYHLKYTILRYGTAYGPRSIGEDVISIFVRKALNRETLIINGDGKQSRKFIYVEDLAEGNIRALEKKYENKTLVLQGLESTTINELIIKIKKILGEVEVVYSPNKRKDDYIGEPESEMNLYPIDWIPKIDLETGISRYIEWYKGLCTNLVMHIKYKETK